MLVRNMEGYIVSSQYGVCACVCACWRGNCGWEQSEEMDGRAKQNWKREQKVCIIKIYVYENIWVHIKFLNIF